MERCPCCNARVGELAICSRCQTDLGTVIDSEQAAQFWVSKAIHYWQEGETEQSLNALDFSLCLKKTEIALVFRDFLIHQQSKRILELLEQQQLLSAKQHLYRTRGLIGYSKLLRQLQGFTDYLLVKGQEQSESFWLQKPNAQPGEISDNNDA